MRAGLLLLLVLAACGDEARTGPCLDRVDEAPDGAFAELEAVEGDLLRVTYDDGLVLEVPKRPRRIVSTAPGLTETIAYLDGLEHVVGVTPWCNFPEGVQRIAKIEVMRIDFEGLVALRPDLVVADRTLHRSSLEALLRRFPGMVLLLETSRSLAHYTKSLAILTRVLGSGRSLERGRRWVVQQVALHERLAGRLRDGRLAARVGSDVTAERAPLRVLVVSQWEPLNVIGPGGLMHDLLRECGCVNVAADLGMPSGPFNEELVLERRPDVILHRGGPPPARFRERWGTTPAFQTGRVGDCEVDDLSRGGPRILGALERLFGVLRENAPMTSLTEIK